MKTKTIVYWTPTAIVAFLIGSGGAAELAHLRGNVEGLSSEDFVTRYHKWNPLSLSLFHAHPKVEKLDH